MSQGTGVATMPARVRRAAPLTAEQIERRMQERWFALIQAEDAGKDASELERLFVEYMAELDALVAARTPHRETTKRVSPRIPHHGRTQASA